MASVVIAGNTSGTVTLSAPDIAGSTTLTLPTTSGTIVTTAGGTTVPFALGSAASPSITFTGDTNTGIFSPGADTIGFSEGGAEIARFDSSGNFGIGASPSFGLTVVKDNGSGYVAGFRSAAGSPMLTIQNTGGISQIQGLNSALSATADIALQVSGGNVGIGTSSIASGGAGTTNFNVHTPSANTVYFKLSNAGTGNTTSDGFDLLADSSGNAYLYNRENANMLFGTNNTERMRITSAGDMSMGGVPASPPTVSNDIFSGGLYLNPTRRTTGNSGNTFWDTGGAFFRSTSSIKYKTDVNDATYGLSDVLKLRPVTYKGKSELDGDKIFGGFIAEEIDALGLKEFVVYDQDNQPDALAYANMVSLLTKAIQEQQAIINEQASTIAAFEARLVALENK